MAGKVTKSIGRLEIWDTIVESDNEDGTETVISQCPEYHIIWYDGKLTTSDRHCESTSLD